jgi:hypothetical protein
LVDAGSNSEGHQATNVESGTVKVNGSSTEVCREDKGESVGDESETGVDETELE